MKNFDELKVFLYNRIVNSIESKDTLCREDNKWFAIGYLQAWLDANGYDVATVLTIDEINKILYSVTLMLVENEVI